MLQRLPEGHRLSHFVSLDSTNAEAQRQWQAGERGPLWIWAGAQTAGRGRLGRHWVSEEGNLYATLLFTVDALPAVAAQVSLVAALAVRDTAMALTGSSGFALKWPNDVLLNGAKFAGILPEALGGSVTPKLNDSDSSSKKSSSRRKPGPIGLPGNAVRHSSVGPWVPACAGMTTEELGGSMIVNSGIAIALGIGMNLAHAPQGTPYPVTALGGHIAPRAALETLAAALAHWLAVWDEARGFAAIRAAWLDAAIGRDAPASAFVQGREITGLFTGLAEDGALILTAADGAAHSIHAGEVRFSALEALRTRTP